MANGESQSVVAHDTVPKEPQPTLAVMPVVFRFAVVSAVAVADVPLDSVIVVAAPAAKAVAPERTANFREPSGHAFMGVTCKSAMLPTTP